MKRKTTSNARPVLAYALGELQAAHFDLQAQIARLQAETVKIGDEAFHREYIYERVAKASSLKAAIQVLQKALK